MTPVTNVNEKLNLAKPETLKIFMFSVRKVPNTWISIVTAKRVTQMVWGPLVQQDVQGFA